VTDVHNYRYVRLLLIGLHWLISFAMWWVLLSSSFHLGYRLFVATWNVAGKSPPSNLNLEDWLHTSPPADIYVLGYSLLIKCWSLFYFS
jgi:hypothetical protein